MGLFNKRKDHQGLDDDALNYFRSNNDEIIKPEKWALVIIAGIVISIIFGIGYGYISYMINLHFSLILIFLGYILALVLKKITGSGSTKLAIIALSCYLLLVLFSMVSTYAVAYAEILGGSFINYLFKPNIWKLMIESLFDISSISTILIYAIGGVATYQYANQ